MRRCSISSRKKGFKFSFDGIVIEAAADHQRESAVTKLSGIGGEAEISRKGAYSYNKDGESYVFTALPKETFPVYFQTNDGIKTEMSLAAGLTHTRITVTQSQLFDFDGVYPKLEYKGNDIDWSESLTPDSDTFTYTIDGRNYVKAALP